MTLLNEFAKCDRKEKRKVVEHLLDIQKKKLDLFERNLIQMQKDNIRLGNLVLKNQEHIEMFLGHTRQVSKWINDFLKNNPEN